MASVHPVMVGQFGTTEYYMLTMKAGDVANQLIIPKEMPDWDDMELEERFQREINYNRVRTQIAPYLALDPDRFFGALIVDVINGEEMEFEPLGRIAGKPPKLYETAARAFGFLTLSGKEVLVPLDGQHRLAALKFALSGKDERQRPITLFDPNTEIATDDILLILVKHDRGKARKIFNKVNRYAKPTSKADNLITSDDDVVAIIARNQIANELIGSRLVQYGSNTLSKGTHHFTTLATIYEATKHILEAEFGKISDRELPDSNKKSLYQSEAVRHWKQLLDGVSEFTLALADQGMSGDKKRVEIRNSNLLGKPIAQLAVVWASVYLVHATCSDGSRIAFGSIVERINKVDWSMDNLLWQKILMDGQRVVSGRQAANFAGRFISYYLGLPLDEVELGDLASLYRARFPATEQASVQLPERLVSP